MNRPRAKITTYRARGSRDDGLLRWRVKSANGEDIAKVSEGYHHEADRVKSIQLTYEACLDWLKTNQPDYFMDKGEPVKDE